MKKEKLQKNPMSLKEHIKNERARISLFIKHASFKKFMTKQFNWIKTQDCQVEGCTKKQQVIVDLMKMEVGD